MRLRLRNRDGTVLDPVPFLVAASTAFVICFAWGPLYFLTLGYGLELAVGASTAVFVILVAVAYYRLVWTYDPAHRDAVPGPVRLKRIIFASFVGIALLVALLLPLYRWG